MLTTKKSETATHLYRALSERLQSNDKEGAIELYCELLNSGHSVGEILDGVGPIRGKLDYRNAEIANNSQLGSDQAGYKFTSEVVLAGSEHSNLFRTRGQSVCNDSEIGSIIKLEATESTPLNDFMSDDKGRLRYDDACSSKSYSIKLTDTCTSTNCEVSTKSYDEERLRPSTFLSISKYVSFSVLYMIAVVALSIAGFSILRGDRETKSLVTYIQGALVHGTEAIISPGNAADRLEASAEPLKSIKQEAVAQSAYARKSPEPSKSALASLGPAQGVRAEISATTSSIQAQVQGLESGRPGAIRDSVRGAASMLGNSPATVPTQAAEAAHDTDPARTRATEPATAAISLPTATEVLKRVPEAHDSASATSVETAQRIGGDRSGMPGADPAATTRAEQPDAVQLPAHEAAAPASVPLIAEIAPKDPRFMTMTPDALVSRGDTFFAAGDLTSARLFYEHAVAAGNAVAALRLGGTFDPSFLARARIGRVQGDAAIALYWYRRARDLGDSNAEILLKKMEKLAR